MKDAVIMLTDGNISIIPLEERHLEPLRQLRNHPQTRFYLTSTAIISKGQQQAWFKKLKQDKGRQYYAVEKRGKFVGVVRSDEWDKANQSVRIGVDIVPEYRRQGMATRTYQLLLDYLFHQLNFHRVWLLVAEFNQAALRLYKKLGFKKEGAQRQALWRNEKWHDYIMMSLLKKEYGQK